MKQTEKIYFPNLDGLRFIAFSMVFFAHCLFLLHFSERTVIIKGLNKVIGNADLGVNFFFVLSGFLISYLLLKEKEKHGKIDIKAFYMRRVLRIWPVYFIVIAIALMLSLSGFQDYSLHKINFSLVVSFLTNFDLAYNGISSVPITVLWSVAVEEQFYFILPILILLFGKKIFKYFPLFIVGCLIYRLYNYQNIRITEFHTLSVFPALLLGCISAYMVIYKSLDSMINKLSKKAIFIIYGVLLFLILSRTYLFANQFGVAFNSIIFSFFFAFIILEQNYSTRSFYKMSDFKKITELGKYTYGMYAYHIIFITLLSNLYQANFGAINNYIVYFIFYFLALIISVFFSIASYNIFEIKFLNLKDKIYNRK